MTYDKKRLWLITDFVLNNLFDDLQFSQIEIGNDRVKEREKAQDEPRKGTKIGHRRINEDGQITYKKVFRACGI